MGEYGKEQRNKLSRVIVNSKLRSGQLKEIVDNRACAAMQKNEGITIQCLTMDDNEVLKNAWNEHQDDYYDYLEEQSIVLDSGEICNEDHGEAAQFKVIQCARTGNTISGPKTIGSNVGVCFLRDQDGNIDFSDPQQGYIGNSLGIDFTNSNSTVDISPAVATYTKYNRYQHFKYANDNTTGTIKGNFGSSPDGWTWHHLTAPHFMHLVDRGVHRSFGHNGGVHVW